MKTIIYDNQPRWGYWLLPILLSIGVILFIETAGFVVDYYILGTGFSWYWRPIVTVVSVVWTTTRYATGCTSRNGSVMTGSGHL